MKDNLTEIMVILDRSGSMSSIRDDAMGGFNSFIEDQKKEAGDALVTLVQFDHEYEVVYSGKQVQDVRPLTAETYVPRGQTALLDAIGRTINEVGARLSAMTEDDRPGKVIAVVITDGHENASHEFRQDKIKEMIEHQRGKYDWEFVFLAADPTSVQLAQAVSVPMGNVALFENTGQGVRSAYAGVSHAVSGYRGGTKSRTGLVDKDDSGTVK